MGGKLKVDDEPPNEGLLKGAVAAPKVGEAGPKLKPAAGGTGAVEGALKKLDVAAAGVAGTVAPPNENPPEGAGTEAALPNENVEEGVLLGSAAGAGLKVGNPAGTINS